jgi:ubiquinone/menaquinone biosynthesis C-methylase UbiE/uncharacterized protein YbaR (Trm112 family)
MRASTLHILECPNCHGHLTFDGAPQDPICNGTFQCTTCLSSFPIENGITHFLELAQLDGLNRRFSRTYDWLSWIYRSFSKIAFAYIGMKEETGRREITDRLDPHGGKVLEVSIGPGVNLPYLIRRKDVGEITGLDISIGQLRRCQSYVRSKGWEVDLFHGNGEQLPFRDATFEGVFHVGGINFFSNKKAAIDEMIRVAKPGTRVLIADETEKGARGYERAVPGFKKSFQGRRETIVPPVDLVPEEMLETHVFDAWKGWMYCLEFCKP